ncbi:40S ribosomal protein S15-3 [Abeliophyllum distichum]|uniref:40S ribosomal protein S15-3 n=1 Tax=Abeliophyllum distichum TaxID=126358 RepID=A0ABD1UHU4_9LAMI
MSPIFHLVKEINLTKIQWAVQVRIVPIWEIPICENSEEVYNLEIVFVDKNSPQNNHGGSRDRRSDRAAKEEDVQEVQRGVDLDALLDISTDELVKLFHARVRRRFQKGLKRKPMALIKKLRKSKCEAPPGEKPEIVKTHLRNKIIVHEMIGSVIGVYNGKTFNTVEIKPEMIRHYLAKFSISYKPVKHGRPAIGATHSSRFIPLK